MSSTNRSKAREEHVADYYITPIDEIEKFLKCLVSIEGNIFENARVLEPCSGGDSEHEMSYPVVLERYIGRGLIDTIDIRGDSLAKLKADC